MILSRLAIDNAPFTAIVLVLLALLGATSFLAMPRAEDPRLDLATVTVATVYPGASPEDVEELAVDPLEDELAEIDDVDRIETTIQDGVAVTTVEFVSGLDPDDAKEDVDRVVAEVRPTLPDAVRSVETSTFTTSNVVIYQVALVSDDAPVPTMRRTAERVEEAFERVPGVKQAETWAHPDEEVHVRLDWDRIRETGVSMEQIVGAIQGSAQNLPGGDVDVGARRFAVQTSGGYESIEDVRRTVVDATGGRVVYLRDVAEVAAGTAEPTHEARFNGRRAVFVTATQRENVNIYDVADGLRAAVDEARAGLPGGVELAEVFDQSESVRSRVNGFFSSLLQGILLVGGVILLALGLRASVIVMLAIPLSVLIALWGLDVTGYGLQQISIVGLVIALGLLVDDAIVITENVARYRRKGHAAIDAALKGTAEVGWAVVSTSVTSVLAFLPIVLVESESGQFIRSLPVTVIYALAASLLVSLTLTPVLASRWMEGAAGPDGGGRADGPLARWLGRLSGGAYRRTLRAALKRPATVLAVAVAALAGSAALFPIVGVSFFPDAEKPQFLVSVTTPEGTPRAETGAAVGRVEAWLEGRPEVRRFAANVGRDNPLIYYNEVPRRETATHGQVYVELHEAEAVPRVAAALQEAVAGDPRAAYEPVLFKNGPPVEAPIAIKVVGPELETLGRLAAGVERLLRQTPGTRNVDNPIAEPKTDLHVNVDRDRAGLLGVRPADVDRTVRLALEGLAVASFRDRAGDTYDVVVRLPGTQARLSDLDRLSVSGAAGAEVPLRAVASVELERVPVRIDHFDTERAVTVTADVDTRAGYTAVGVTRAVVEGLEARAWPRGYRTVVGGELEAQEDSFASLLPALVGAVLGILAVLVLQFGSLWQPLIIVVAIPLSVVGAVPALLVTGYTFSFTAFIGFTSLVGIVVNNSTILVDYANQLRAEGRTVGAAVRAASEVRFAPIVLTTLTTIGGLLPLTLTGSSLWSPLGWVIIGGLLVSTGLSLLVVPVLYRLITAR
jgi:multidrug efflux pump subunit AcrB